jgi:hypothetical protein
MIRNYALLEARLRTLPLASSLGLQPRETEALFEFPEDPHLTVIGPVATPIVATDRHYDLMELGRKATALRKELRAFLEHAPFSMTLRSHSRSRSRPSHMGMTV